MARLPNRFKNNRNDDDESTSDHLLKEVIAASVRIANIGIPQADKIGDVDQFIATSNLRTALSLLTARLILKLRNTVEYDLQSLKTAAGIAKDLQAIEEKLHPELYSHQQSNEGLDIIDEAALDQLLPLEEYESAE